MPISDDNDNNWMIVKWWLFKRLKNSYGNLYKYIYKNKYIYMYTRGWPVSISIVLLIACPIYYCYCWVITVIGGTVMF